MVLLLAIGPLAACGAPPAPPGGIARNENLDRAFAAAVADPSRAAALFAETEAGPSLERARFIVWADCLKRVGAGAEQWRLYLAQHPPADLAGRARLALISVLDRDGLTEEIVQERDLLPESLQPRADELLLSAEDPSIRAEAANRLVVTSPGRLRSHDRKIDQDLLTALPPASRIDRARAWRLQGSPARAAAELRSQRFSGEIDRQRRRELARSEIASGAPLRALNALPPPARSTAEDLVLRAQAYRNRAWHLFPGRGERKVFDDCRSAAERSLTTAGIEEHRHTALGLVLECATESGDLETALESWWRLEALGFEDSRREWLGRRLGIALVRSGADEREVSELARAVPSQRRCLSFWVASRPPIDRGEMERLASAAFADLYAIWARELLGLGRPETVAIPLKSAEGAAPESVQRLIQAGLEADAVREWRRIRGSRSTTPDEALAAAELAQEQGFATDHIRWLRAGYPELGTIDMAAAPGQVVAEYLPLRWSGALVAAAEESGVDPWLLAAIARQESGFTAHARSPRGAVGVLQLLPSTARGHARALGLTPPLDLQDPTLNIRIGAREFAFLLRRFEAVEPALAAYNGGMTRARKWWKRWPDRRRFTEEIPVPESYNYVRRVTYLAEAYRLVHREEWRSPP
jgi:soluble lytic murein transglycosylase